MLLRVHDELVFDLFKPKKRMRSVVEDKMKHAIRISVPIEVEWVPVSPAGSTLKAWGRGME
jgi:DNA polymerase I-like protein with 3'-5' exonuclease and polymerase domains